MKGVPTGHEHHWKIHGDIHEQKTSPGNWGMVMLITKRRNTAIGTYGRQGKLSRVKYGVGGTYTCTKIDSDTYDMYWDLKKWTIDHRILPPNQRTLI